MYVQLQSKERHLLGAEVCNSIQESTLKGVWSQLLDLEEDEQSILENETAQILNVLKNIPRGDVIENNDVEQ